MNLPSRDPDRSVDVDVGDAAAAAGRHRGVRLYRGVALPPGPGRSHADRGGQPVPPARHPAGRAETVALYRTWLAGDHPTVRGFGAAALAPCHREVLLDLAAGDGVARQLAAGRAVDQVAVGNVVRTRR